ncbi:archaea-specific SMC-related protein [Halomarina halobia]|uniref:Archaea-specific SMC-related protein n=1 Tax=Halomarina halobia TaxID=3033386 RepID=A0ABD6AD80_9EURY|nr:archaea-specific SMC-related protein [Halomarina sp. PSR21]
MEQKTKADVDLHVRNVGGIEETATSLSPGVNVLSGRNATNRTSLLQAIMAACGSNGASLKGDADEGSVELAIGDETYTRRLTRTDGSLTFSGDPYLDDADVADLFAFLLESNEARLAVARQENLRDIIMRPVDTDQLQAEIEQLEAEKRQLRQELEDLDGLDERLPDLEQERKRLEQRLEEKREELEEKQAELDAADRDVEETREEKSELESKFEELRETRSQLEDVRYDIETQRERLSSLREDRADAEDDLDELSETPAGDIADIESDIRQLRERKQRLEADISDLQNIIQFNQDLLDDANSDVLEALDANTDTDAESGGSVTDQLLEEEQVTCWTCGSPVEADQIEGTVDRLRELSQRKVGDVREVESELDDLTSEKRELERERQRREQLERSVDRLDDDIEGTEGRIAELEERRDELQSEVDSLETAVEDLETTDYGEVLDLHREVNQLEFEIDRIGSDIHDIDEEVASIESRLAEREQIEAQLEELQDELTDLRTRIERIEEGAVSEFNEHMETVLDILEYSNLERVWIERTERDVREGRRKVTKSMFDLHVIRASESGTAYEDTIDHLSESEREVTGLVFALAGYLVHDVYETCPFMLLDSLEAIDADRIARLVDYFADYASYLVVALLEDDAQALDQDYHRVTEI